VFAALAAIGALQADGVPHARCVGMIETCEESGSYDLPAYLEALSARMAASISSSGSTRAAAITSACG
jgi:acetylornithine deacetylase/succinyl-diaminopimelate desuccinylase-like protein